MLNRFLHRCVFFRILVVAFVVALWQPLAFAQNQGVQHSMSFGATRNEACMNALGMAGIEVMAGVAVTDKKCECEERPNDPLGRPWSCIGFVSWTLNTTSAPSGAAKQPTIQPVQPAVTNAKRKSKTTSGGTAACTIGDGYQTVRFSDGAVYSGSFQNCRPLAGPAQYQQGSTVLNGVAEPIDDRTVRLRSGNSVATITLQILGR